MATYRVNVTFTELLLGTVPADPEVYKNFIESKKPEDTQDEEYGTVEAREERGWTTFHKGEDGTLFLYDYQVRGFVKEAADALRVSGGHEVKGVRSKIDRFLFVKPRRVAILQADGTPYTKGDGVLERPLRAETRMGPRVCLARSDFVKAGAKIEFDLVSTHDALFHEELLRQLMDRGELVGMGQFRTGSYGRFTYTMVRVGGVAPVPAKVKEVTPAAPPADKPAKARATARV